MKVAIVLKEGKTATPEEIIEFSRERLARYKMPKSLIGKVLRRVLVEEEEAKREKA